MRWLLFRLTAGLRCRRIDRGNHARYLERYYLGSLGKWTFYLHRFVSADGDEEVHNHPWNLSIALILTGGYREQVLLGECPNDGMVLKVRRLWPGRLNILTRRSFHRILTIKPETWTLFFHRSRVQGWGFKRSVCRCGDRSCRGRHFEQGKRAPNFVATVFEQDLPPFKPSSWNQLPLGRDADRAPFMGGK